MRLRLHGRNEFQDFEISGGVAYLGGGETDAVRCEELPPAVLELHREGGRLFVKAQVEMSLSGVTLPADVLRWMLPEERLRLPNGRELCLLETESPGPSPQADSDLGKGTVAMVKDMLADGEEDATLVSPALTCLTGLDVGRVYPLSQTVDIGRGEDAQLRIRDRSVSRRHARLTVSRDRPFQIQDLGGPNGVQLNGELIGSPQPLEHGDRIQLGYTTLRFTLPQSLRSGAKGSALAPSSRGEGKGNGGSGQPPNVKLVRTEKQSTLARFRKRMESDWLFLGAGALFMATGCVMAWWAH